MGDSLSSAKIFSGKTGVFRGLRLGISVQILWDAYIDNSVNRLEISNEHKYSESKVFSNFSTAAVNWKQSGIQWSE